MIFEISRSYVPNSMVDQQPEKEGKIIEGDQGGISQGPFRQLSQYFSQ